MPNAEHHTDEALHDAVAVASRRIAGRLFGRYVPLYAAAACLLLISVLVPSTVSREGQARAEEAAGSVAGSPAPSISAVPVAAGDRPSAPTVPSPALTGPAHRPSGGEGFTPPPLSPRSPGGRGPEPGGNDGFNEDVPPCPLEIGEDPVVSRSVASALLGAASPALSALGPLGPNAVPALGVLSPVLPVIAPVADAFAPYIRALNPLFLQISQFGTMLWDGPLQPLEAPLLEANAAFIQPFEVELLAALADPINQVNATPVTPCLQRVVYNVVAPLPIPDPPSLPAPSP
jgi:hypothetical protein